MSREEAISREAVLDYLESESDNFPDYHEAIEHVLDIPSVTQKSKIGYWIAHSDGGIWIKYYECSDCGKVHDTHSDYCPNCGAKMESEEQTE